MEERSSWHTRITPDLARLHRGADEHFSRHRERGGTALYPAPQRSAGFLRVLDDRTIGFVDFAGNRQYINLADDSQDASIRLCAPTAHQDLGEARVIEGGAELIAKLMPEGYRARPEQVILFTVSAWDANCPQPIPQRFEAADVAAALAERDRRIAELETEIARLRADILRKAAGAEHAAERVAERIPARPPIDCVGHARDQYQRLLAVC